MDKLKFCKQEIKFHLGLNVLMAVFITIASYVHFPFGSLKGNLIYLAHFLLLQFTLFGFVYLFSLFSRIFKIIFPLLFILVTSFSFWVYTQDLTVSPEMIHGVFGTNIGEATDIVSYPFLIFIAISSLSIFYFFKYHTKTKKSSLKSPLFYAAILGVLTFFIVENYKYDAFKNRLPYNIYFGAIESFKKPKIKLKEVKENTFTNEENLHIVLVIGETLRADHLSLNGYHRNTTPLLSKQENLISFKDVYTPFTFTSQSLPQILTDKSVDSKNIDLEATSLYTILNKASFASEWIGNQVLEKSYKEVVNSNTSKIIIDELHSFLSFKKEKDLKLLDYFSADDSFIGNKISTLHMIGSHWYYNNRITPEFEYFKPTTASKHLGSSTKEAIVNSYDNTILYFDNFLNKLIEELKQSSKKTILIYLSDHGETLGEDGKWLHSERHKASQNPAMLVWYSNNFKESYPIKIKQLKFKKNNSITTDFLFHSVLDLGEIENYKYQKNQSIFN
ncbi:MAG: phosphoethanolamine transferase [Polaribacter sp.]